MRIKTPVMRKNDDFARLVRNTLKQKEIFAFNIISSPGAGKTTLLEALAKRFGNDLAVIEGDVKTQRDALRIREAGCRAIQIETNGACHLDARAVKTALETLDIQGVKFLAIENVGNLICPSSYDLGEHIKIGMLSIPEGDDKVLKYPSLFSRIDLFLINKTDLAEHIEFDMDRAEKECRSLNPKVKTLRLSAKSGEGIDDLVRFLREREK
jgi:hydrogenase nickel incorporation protein HypB